MIKAYNGPCDVQTFIPPCEIIYPFPGSKYENHEKKKKKKREREMYVKEKTLAGDGIFAQSLRLFS